MSETTKCPQCGKPVPEASPGGLCPECMLRVGAAAPTEEFGPEGTRVVRPVPRESASVDEIAKLFPHLEILECLGRGGMGVVYKARQPKLNRLVALKILAPERESDPKFAERFTREAQALARLSHPNIVAVHDFGETDGVFYLLMEFVDGVNLRTLIQAGRVAPEQALAVVPKICEALQYAHEQGSVHRDIKPENVLLDQEGRVKIADFGIAKLIRPEADQPSITEDGTVGTPHYMAPEQVEQPKTVDHRADIYSLGVVFYEMLTGELPLGKFAPPSRKVQIDVRLDEVVLHALEKEPARRYQHVSQVKTDVETIAAGAAASEGRPAGSERRDAPDSKAPAASAVLSRMEVARSQVRGPAIGLLITGLLSWGWLLAALGFATALMQSTQQVIPAAMGIVVVLLPLLLIGFLIFAALKMRRLQCYTVAIIASVAAILSAPGNFIGLPIGIWALVVLLRKDVREAFHSVHSGIVPAPDPSGSSSVQTNGGSARGCFFVTATVCLIGVGLIVLLVISSLIASFTLPAIHRARDHAREVAAQHAPHPEPVPAPRVLAFDPVIERVVNDPDFGVGSEALDLDAGESLNYPTDPRTEDLIPWIAEQGGDFMAGRRTTWGIGTTTMNELKLIQLTSGDWENLTPNALLDRLRAAPDSILVKEDGRDDPVKVHFLPEVPEFPVSFGFRTQQGGRGLLQLAGFTDNARGLKLRYKLAQESNSSSSSDAPDREVVRVKLEAAEATLADLEARFNAGQVSSAAVARASMEVGVLQGQLEGDPARVAAVRLEGAQNLLELTRHRFEVGLIPRSELVAAEAEVQVRELEARALETSRPDTPGSPLTARVQLMEADPTRRSWRWRVFREPGARMVYGVLDATDPHNPRQVLLGMENDALTLTSSQDYTLRLDPDVEDWRIEIETAWAGENGGRGAIRDTINVPAGARLQAHGSQPSGDLNTDRYHVFWQAELASDQGPLKRLRFVARLAAQDDPVQNILGETDPVRALDEGPFEVHQTGQVLAPLAMRRGFVALPLLLVGLAIGLGAVGVGLWWLYAGARTGKALERLALLLAVGGPLFALLIALVLSRFGIVGGLLFLPAFLAFEIPAFCLGLLSRATGPGKAAMIVSVTFMVVSLVFLL